MQYACRYIAGLIIICETLLNQGFANPRLSWGRLHNANKKWVVVIDAGHGGKDPGCHGLKYKEKDIALAVALKFGHYLETNNKDVKVIYTRKTDEFIPLDERAGIANRNHADFFICIHCNAARDKGAYGSATYVMGLYKAEGNLEVSKRENQSILFEKDYKEKYDGFDPNSDEGNILFAMYQNMYLKQSLDLSSKIQKEYNTRAARFDNGVKQAGFLVLWKTAMPSLLTEIGFLTNAQEELYLGSQSGQQHIAKSIFYAFEQYKNEVDGTAYNVGSFDLGDEDTGLSTADAAVSTDSLETPASTKPSEPTSTKPSIPISTTVNATSTTLSVQPPPTVKVSNSNATVSDTLKYRVQFISAAQPIPMNDKRFEGIPDVQVYLDNTVYKYTAGNFISRLDASALQNKLRKQGYPDAFVALFSGGKRVVLAVR